MKTKNLKALLPLAAIAITATANAGSVITTNLPANTVIMNIDARNEGAANWDAGQSNWWQPFAANGQFAEVTLGPGTYTFRLTNPTAAAAEFTSLTAPQLSQMYTAWTYNSPWTTDYFMFNKNANNNVNGSALFAGAIIGRVPNWQTYPGANSGGFNTAANAYNAAFTGGVYDKIYTGPGGRLTGTEQTSYTFASTTTIYGVIPDSGVFDNNGGLSIVIETVPEPATMTLLGLGALALIRKKRKA